MTSWITVLGVVLSIYILVYKSLFSLGWLMQYLFPKIDIDWLTYKQTTNKFNQHSYEMPFALNVYTQNTHIWALFM